MVRDGIADVGCASAGMRPTWKLTMMVLPNEKLPGSTSVACWLDTFVKVSVLSWTMGVVAGGKLDPC